MKILRNLVKKSSIILTCLVILLVSFPNTASAALEPGDGIYRIKNVGTGEYLYHNTDTSLGWIFTYDIRFTSSTPEDPSSLEFIIQNTTGSNKWFSIRPVNAPDFAFSFPTNDSYLYKLQPYIPGDVGRYESLYSKFVQQRFNFRFTPSGYFISPIDYNNNVENRVLDVITHSGINFPICGLKKANGSRTQIFTLEYVRSIN